MAPGTFLDLWSASRVYRASLIMLRAVTTAPLDAYAELVRAQAGRVDWRIAYEADVAMREYE